MAIGDTLNQNLFGTNYNAEDEERRKAELAAQGAIIGIYVLGIGMLTKKLRAALVPTTLLCISLIQTRGEPLRQQYRERTLMQLSLHEQR